MIDTAVQRVIAAYNQLGDRGRYDDFLSLFHPDATLETAMGVCHGIGEIRAFLDEVGAMFRAAEGFLPARHHVASLLIEPTSPSSATARSYFSVITPAGLDHWGVYDDTVAADDGAWTFRSRRIRIEGARDGSPVQHLVERRAAT